MRSVDISVVVPIYNVEKYLRECLDSLKRQTYDHFEVIMVDDGSTDGSAGIAKEYERENNNFTLIQQENKGLSEARNIGINAAQGKYIYFLDSDVYIIDNAIEILHKKMKEDELDDLLFSSYVFYDDNPELSWKCKGGFKYKGEYNGVYKGPDLLSEFVRNGDTGLPSCCMLMTDINIINRYGLRFYEGIIHEDNLFHLELLSCGEHVSVLNIPCIAVG